MFTLLWPSGAVSWSHYIYSKEVPDSTRNMRQRREDVLQINFLKCPLLKSFGMEEMSSEDRCKNLLANVKDEISEICKLYSLAGSWLKSEPFIVVLGLRIALVHIGCM